MKDKTARQRDAAVLSILVNASKEQWVGLPTRKERNKKERGSGESERYDAVPFISGQLELPPAEIRRPRKMSGGGAGGCHPSPQRKELVKDYRKTATE